MKTLLPLIDFFVFAVLTYFAALFYVTEPSIFDTVHIIALLYVMVRRFDVNTVTLVLVILTVKIAESLIFADISGFSGYTFHASIMLLSFVCVFVVSLRAYIVSQLLPSSSKLQQNLTVTHQDLVIGFTFLAQAMVQLLMLFEASLRNIGDFDFTGTLDQQWWFENARLLYDNYKSIQFGLAMLGILVLWLMTVDVKQLFKARAADQTTTNNNETAHDQ